LRRRFISNCQKDLNNKINEYQNELRQQCDEMLEYDEIITSN
jgi:hypothetical protein